jgi:hypothetical protein
MPLSVGTPKSPLHFFPIDGQPQGGRRKNNGKSSKFLFFSLFGDNVNFGTPVYIFHHCQWLPRLIQLKSVSFDSELQGPRFQARTVGYPTVRAGPCRSVPVRAGPCRSVPVRAGPCRSVPVRAGLSKPVFFLSGLSWSYPTDCVNPLSAVRSHSHLKRIHVQAQRDKDAIFQERSFLSNFYDYAKEAVAGTIGGGFDSPPFLVEVANRYYPEKYQLPVGLQQGHLSWFLYLPEEKFTKRAEEHKTA